MKGRIHSVGHSNRPIEELVDLIQDVGGQWVADLRRYPGSRRNPQYNQTPLAQALDQAGIGYRHFPALGAFREVEQAPVSVQGLDPIWWPYAVHMQGAEFAGGVLRLEELAQESAVVLLCAEREPERCHRFLLADVLSLRDWEVVHIVGPGDHDLHSIHPLARPDGGVVHYPHPQQSLFDL